MTHPRHTPRPPTEHELRSFAFTVGLAFLTIGALLYWRDRRLLAVLPGAVGAALVVAGVAAPRRLGPAHHAWMALALAISRVTTPVFMGLVYFGIVTPLGLVMRLAGRHVLRRAPDAATFWVDRSAGSRRSDLHRQF